MARLNFSQFRYRPLSPGHYHVEYTTKRGRFVYECIVTDMPLIDAVFYDYEYPEQPRQCNLQRLYNYIKSNGYRVS